MAEVSTGIDRAELIKFMDEISELEDDKKALSDSIKDAIVAFADENKLDKAAVKAAIKAYKKIMKDRQQFTEEYTQADQLVETILAPFTAAKYNNLTNFNETQ